MQCLSSDSRLPRLQQVEFVAQVTDLMPGVSTLRLGSELSLDGNAIHLLLAMETPYT